MMKNTIRFAGILAVSLAMVSPGDAQKIASNNPHGAFPETRQSSPAFDFSIGRMPLDHALDIYRETTGVKLFYDSQLVSGRTSQGAAGRYSAEEALVALLANTQLDFVRTDHDIVTLVPAGMVAAAEKNSIQAVALALPTLHVETPAGYEVSHFVYGSVVETVIRGALLQERELKARRYRADMLVWVEPNGTLQRFELASSTGNKSVDDTITQVLGRITLPQTPPSDLPQPLHIRIHVNG